MLKNSFKSITFLVFLLSSFVIKAQDAPPSEGVFRIQNVATGKYLTDAGSSATAVTMSASGEAPNTHFRFVQSGAYYNIDSETLGILRAPGAGGPGGDYVIVSTTKASPASDTDKTWTIYHNSTNDTYRFESRTAGRFMYHEENGTVTHSVVANTDDRSNWKLVPFVQTPVEVAPDEDTKTDLNCPASGEFRNDNTRDVDIPNSVNVGTADDRSCYSDYSEVDLYGKKWGVYNITDGSNHWDGTTLQPRIERSLPRSSETGVGSYARFTGTFRILEVGDTGSFNSSGTYIAQAKGKHTGEGGSNDPAILLYRAHPIYGDGINAGKQVAFDIYAERILVRGGEGNGREVVFLKRVAKNEEVDFVLEVGFRQDPNDNSKKIHYCDAIIGGEAFNYIIPEPERGLESGIRYGAYRVHGGRAQIRWANTTYQKVEIEDNSNNYTPSNDVFRLQNVATGKFLTDAGSSATAVTMTDSGEPTNTHWKFVESGSYFNIDSETLGVLRAPGSGGPGGAYVIVSTTKEAPTSDSDKTWTITYNQSEETYRFESRTAGRFLYHNEDGTVTHSLATADDDRSKWKAIPTSQSLSTTNNVLEVSKLKVYPNPATTKFTIQLHNIEDASVTIYTILGKKVYQKLGVKESLEIMTSNRFEAGVYLIKVTEKNQKIHYHKLIIN